MGFHEIDQGTEKVRGCLGLASRIREYVLLNRDTLQDGAFSRDSRLAAQKMAQFWGRLEDDFDDLREAIEEARGLLGFDGLLAIHDTNTLPGTQPVIVAGKGYPTATEAALGYGESLRAVWCSDLKPGEENDAEGLEALANRVQALPIPPDLDARIVIEQTNALAAVPLEDEEEECDDSPKLTPEQLEAKAATGLRDWVKEHGEDKRISVRRLTKKIGLKETQKTRVQQTDAWGAYYADWLERHPPKPKEEQLTDEIAAKLAVQEAREREREEAIADQEAERRKEEAQHRQYQLNRKPHE